MLAKIWPNLFFIKRQLIQILVKVTFEQVVLYDAIFFKLRLGMQNGVFVAHAAGIAR